MAAGAAGGVGRQAGYKRAGSGLLGCGPLRNFGEDLSPAQRYSLQERSWEQVVGLLFGAGYSTLVNGFAKGCSLL